MPLSEQGVQGIKSFLDAVTSEGPTGSPGLAFHAVDRSGKTLVEHQAGNLSIDSKQAVNEDTLFWIASCTKLVTAVALLQLVEQGKIGLDDAEAVKKYAPEISKKQVYADGINGVDQENQVTLRMLLAHTAGFGYAFFDPRLQVPNDLEGQTGDVNDILNSRLVNQPGSKWEYGVSLCPQSTRRSHTDTQPDQHRLGRPHPGTHHRPTSGRLFQTAHLPTSGHGHQRRNHVPPGIRAIQPRRDAPAQPFIGRAARPRPPLRARTGPGQWGEARRLLPVRRRRALRKAQGVRQDARRDSKRGHQSDDGEADPSTRVRRRLVVREPDS